MSWVTVGGCAAPPSEEGLGLLVVGDIHIRVCMSNSCEVGMMCCSPHGSLLEQVAVASFF